MIDETLMMEALEARAVRRDGRRAFFKAALGAAAVGAGGLAVSNVAQAVTVPTEADILNFALNLEYLEANFYSFAVYGTALDATLTSGTGTAGAATGTTTKLTFTDVALGQLANEIAEDEIAHVKYLRGVLKTNAVAQPQIDLSPTAFGTVAAAAKLPAGTAFNPYADEPSFLLGAFLFEDLGVTAYRGAMSALAALTTPTALDAASALLSVEAGHAAAIRAHIQNRGVSANAYVATDTTGIVTNAGLISDYRDSLDGASDDDQGIVPITTTQTDPRDASGATMLVQSNIALLHDTAGDADNGLVFSRTTSQVLNIVYGANKAATSGGFFPKGVNGTINSSAVVA